MLWSKPTGLDWGDLGDADFPFRITLPKNVGGYSTANFQDYRIFWRIEAGAFIGTVPLVSHINYPPRPKTYPSLERRKSSSKIL